jgi:hypothetical protein
MRVRRWARQFERRARRSGKRQSLLAKGRRALQEGCAKSSVLVPKLLHKSAQLFDDFILALPVEGCA